jgi:hypothetical protein
MKTYESLDELRLEIDLLGNEKFDTIVDDTLFATKFFPDMLKFEDMDIICNGINVSNAIRTHKNININ